MIQYSTIRHKIERYNMAIFSEDELYTITEVKKKLKVSENTVKNYIRDGRLMVCNLTEKTIRIKGSELNKFLDTAMNTEKEAEEHG